MPYPTATTKLYLGSKVQVVGDAFNFNGASVDFSSSTINYGSNGIDKTVSDINTRLVNEISRAQYNETVQKEKINSEISERLAAESVLQSDIAAIKTSLTADESTIATVSNGITAINTLLSTQDKISLQNPTSDDISNCIDGNNNFIQIVLLQDATSVYSDVLKNADIFDSNNVSTKYIGWTVSGPNVPDNCLIKSYRYDTTYTGYHAIYADTTKIIPYSGDNTTYTLTNLKVESFIALQNSVSDIKKKTDVITYNNGELLLNADVRGAHVIQSTYMNTAQLGAFQSDHINVECDLLMYQATVKNVKNPIDAKDVANKDYVDSSVATLQAQVDQLSGALDSLYLYFFKTTAANVVVGVDSVEPRPYVPNEPTIPHPGK